MLDSHHHLWNYSAEEYPWIPAGSPLARDQLLPELDAATMAAGVDGTVVVQARQVLAESDWLLGLAAQSEVIKGVVGWVPLVDAEVGTELERLAPEKKFKGVRHVLQEEADGYFLRDDFHRGLALLPGFDLRYDLLLFQRQLPVAIKLVDRQPDLGIIVDHIAKPEIRPGRVEDDWKRGMRELAQRDNILGVKFSGVVTEFPEGPVDAGTVRAYFEETLDIFGPEHVMFGTDWPVCLLRIDAYRDWAGTVRELVGALSKDEQDAILTGNCRRAYGL
ncbi:MAG: amidohydrolase family protein [Akkermansiaceae bacterium]|nr:amidohydrolase family protein [Akkermansiaceae bacterium]NNM28395.1 amidohydrolase family protein [Akkermansiaceae bacterium]